MKKLVLGLSVFIFSFLLLSVVNGNKRFLVWSQVLNVWNIDSYENISNDKLKERIYRSPKKFFLIPPRAEDYRDISLPVKTINNETDFQLKIAQIVHIPRKLIMWPIVNFANSLKIDIHSLFSWVCLFLLMGSSVLLALKNNILNKDLFLLNLGALTTLSLPMNGRLLLVFTGVSLFWYLKNQYSKLSKISVSLLVFFALIFSSVSSGTFIVLHAVILSWALINWSNTKAIEKLAIFSPFLISLPFLFIGIFKNLLYYGGGIESILLMLEHGLGRYFTNYIGIGIAVALLGGIFYFRKYFKLTSKNLNFWIIVISIFAGMYGFSSGLSLAPLFMVIFSEKYILGSKFYT